jgi:hypothetical protein
MNKSPREPRCSLLLRPMDVNQWQRIEPSCLRRHPDHNDCFSFRAVGSAMVVPIRWLALLMIPTLRNRNYFQFCWIVPDLEVAIEQWVRSGAGPFFLFESQPRHFSESHYRGVPGDIAPHRAAIGQLGEVQIEVVCPLSDVRSIWTEFIDFGSSGLHHAALYCHDYDAQRAAYLESRATIAFEGLMKGARTCYIDTVESLGFMTQLLSANPTAEKIFGQIRAAAEHWDGRDPIRLPG